MQPVRIHDIHMHTQRKQTAIRVNKLIAVKYREILATNHELKGKSADKHNKSKQAHGNDKGNMRWQKSN